MDEITDEPHTFVHPIQILILQNLHHVIGVIIITIQIEGEPRNPPPPQHEFTRVEEIKEKGQAVFSYKLFDKYPDHVHEDVIDFTPLSNSGYKIYEASKTRQHLAPARTEVDLHIERLTDTWKSLSNFEILTMQLREFEKFYELAVAHRQSSLIIIHGVGVGKLRDEIHEILRTKKEVKYFVNQYHPSYGYGATEIYFQY